MGVIKSSSLVRSPGIPDAEEGLTKSRNKRPQVVYAQCCRRLFHCQNKIERDQIWQHFSVLFTLSPKQSNRKGGARAVDLPARSFDLASPGVAPPLKRGGFTYIAPQAAYTTSTPLYVTDRAGVQPWLQLRTVFTDFGL